MNFRKALVATLLIIIAPVILESCCRNSCGDCFSSKDGGPPHYDFEGMTMHLYERTTYSELPAGTVALSDISFFVNIDAQFTSMLPASMGSAAYACSPAPSIANQKIESIVITSNSDITTNVSSKSSGEDLASIFFVVTEHSNGQISELVGKEFVGNRLEFFSDLRVTSPQTHAFTFRVSLNNGDVYEMTTRGLTLVPE